MIVAAFVAGRVSGPATAPATAPSQAAATPSERDEDGVLVLAVVDHLDRSQMMLIELMNADPDQPVVNISNEQSRARELVAANRVYRQSAAQAGDETTGDVLDELERVFIEIANAPEDAGKAEIEALRARIDVAWTPVPRAGGELGDAAARTTTGGVRPELTGDEGIETPCAGSICRVARRFRG